MDGIVKLSMEQQTALNAMLSGKNVFLTGEAGTGKSTVLREFRSRCDRACVVLAPTGVAAVNAGGSTIHSFFMLRPGLMTPDTIDDIKNSKKRAIIRAAKTIIIDEISMVRSDVFAAIDIRLRGLARGGNANRPFGGKQIILVGDFFQLPPVVKTETESSYLDEHLGGGYAFQTKLWTDAKFKSVFLQEVHRQRNDMRFLSILSSIRHGALDESNVESEDGEKITATEALNRYCRDKEHMPCEPICLCTTNREAHMLNTMARARLKENGSKFVAVVSGKFPEADYPTEFCLELAKGARVMLLCNRRLPDGAFEFVNGDMGVVTAISNSGATPRVWVKLDRDGKEVIVVCNEWKNYTYVIEEDKISGKKVLRQREIGKFTQVPLRLAYAITVHKSQGLSLDCVDLRLGSGCFTHGQLYTALSRCRSLEGLRIDRTVMKDDLILDDAVVQFYKSIERRNKTDTKKVSIDVPTEYEEAIRVYLEQLKNGKTIANATSVTPIVSSEHIRDHIDLKKLCVVYAGQTGMEKAEGETKRENGIGFNKFDAPVLSEIAEGYLSNGWVTREELDEVSRSIQKYRRQWEGKI